MMRYVARQPILDLRGHIFGYELLFRSAREEYFHDDGEHASRTMLDNTVLFGLDKLTNNTPAFVNCTSKTLIESFVEIMPPSLTVLEILEDLEPTAELIAACRRLKAAGYRLALDDFVWRPELEPLVELADFIKIDVLKSGREERQFTISKVLNRSAMLLAEKVESQEIFGELRLEGFTLFQGYYFCRPILLEMRQIPANLLSNIEILRMLRNSPIDMDAVAATVMRNASLTYRLLRLVNSPFYALRKKVLSVKTAIVAIGEEAFRRLAFLAIACEFNSGQPTELLRMAFVRARFCELGAEAFHLDTTEQYLVGLLSLLPAMLCISMEELLPALPLRTEIHKVLIGKMVPEAILLRWIESYEQGKWKRCDELGHGNNQIKRSLNAHYLEAVLWTELALPFTQANNTHAVHRKSKVA
jgi:EAL and modified HD-GYP domain-containing signal transduction protein